MTDKLKKIIEEELKKLPKEAQAAVNSLDWVGMTEETGKKLLFTENQINDLQVETLLVLVGLENAQDYAINIEDNVGTTKDETIKITDEIFQKIFTPIGNILEENIKKNLPSRESTPEQNLNFILSGGDYVAFMEERREQGGNNTPPPERNKTNTPTSPRKMTDIKSKFTI